MTKHKIKTHFALVDVTGKKRHALAAHFAERNTFGPCQEALRIPVVLYGYLDGVNSRDDGTSIEFTMQVERVEQPE